ncbi:MAG: nucleotide exchange factor GrpE [Phycisphaerales bacterium]|nr:nucleotide exchange factor GrpE [Phycisphaerales bacterium]
MTMTNDDMTGTPCEDDARQDTLPVEDVVEPMSDEVIAGLAETVEGEIGEAIRQLIVDRDQAREDRLRALAEVSNNQRRAVENERRIELSARAAIVRGILPVLDQVNMALAQDLESVTTDQFAEGVRIAGDELMKMLAEHGVESIEPSPGDEFDPMQHEAMLKQAADGIEADHIVQVMQSGYKMGERVLRPAKVAVAP